MGRNTTSGFVANNGTFRYAFEPFARLPRWHQRCQRRSKLGEGSGGSLIDHKLAVLATVGR